MIPALISLLSPIVGKIIDKIPNNEEREKAKLLVELELAKIDQSLLQSLIEVDKSQAAINQEEAKSNKLFVSGWRPYVGWVCGAGVSWAFVMKPIMDWAIAFAARFHPELVGFETPVLNTGELMSMLLGLLGLGGLRTFEKYKGVAKK